MRKEGLLNDESEILPGAVFTPQFVQMQTNNFTLIVAPNQLQFYPTDNASTSIISGIISKLQHIPYKAAGLNFTYFSDANDSGGEDLTRGKFTNTINSIYQEFQEDDCKFGSYLSKNFLEFRLKLNVIPVNAMRNNGQTVQKLQYAFNFHVDIPQKDGAMKLIESITKFNECKAYSAKIMDKSL